MREPESAALAAFIPADATLASSALALVEVTRTLRVAGLESEIEGPLEGLVLLDVDRAVLRRAASLADASLRSLDAIHLSTALAVEPEIMLAYDRGLRRAARAQGLRVAAPGAAVE